MAGRMRKDRSRGIERLIYASMWALLVLYPLGNELVQSSRGFSFSWVDVLMWWGGTLPFMLVFNMAFILLFKYVREQEKRKALENLRMQEELKYLKTQINPHFFMNMLNNIHGMVEVDQERAQDMILELSKLMRYVLYEGDNSMTTFANEVKFISSYVALMRQRYHSDKVDVELNVPQYPSDNIKLPPLLFIAFVENAFKHGISYRRKSTVRISLSEDEGCVRFFCRNTKPEKEVDDSSSGGVGLENVRRRLDLLYGEDCSLRIEDGSDYYTVNLMIPCR